MFKKEKDLLKDQGYPKMKLKKLEKLLTYLIPMDQEKSILKNLKQPCNHLVLNKRIQLFIK
jgi:hypothetical protein